MVQVYGSSYDGEERHVESDVLEPTNPYAATKVRPLLAPDPIYQNTSNLTDWVEHYPTGIFLSLLIQSHPPRS